MLEDLRARALGLGQAVRRAGRRNLTLTRIYRRLMGERERAYLELGRLRSSIAEEFRVKSCSIVLGAEGSSER